MSRPMPRLVVFDLAGTTLVDDGSVASAFREVLAADGLKCSAEDVAAVRGASKRAAFRTLAGDPSRADRLFQAFIACLRQRYASAPPREVPGASAVFAWLHHEGVKVALNTGFETSMVETLLVALGWDTGTFDAVVCGDDVEEGRPSPAMLQEALRRTGITDPS